VDRRFPDRSLDASSTRDFGKKDGRAARGTGIRLSPTFCEPKDTDRVTAKSTNVNASTTPFFSLETDRFFCKVDRRDRVFDETPKIRYP